MKTNEARVAVHPHVIELVFAEFVATAPNQLWADSQTLPWAGSGVERVNRTLTEAMVKRYHNDNHGSLRVHRDAFNCAQGHNTLRGLTPCEATCRAGTAAPDRFTSALNT